MTLLDYFSNFKLRNVVSFSTSEGYKKRERIVGGDARKRGSIGPTKLDRVVLAKNHLHSIFLLVHELEWLVPLGKFTYLGMRSIDRDPPSWIAVRVHLFALNGFSHSVPRFSCVLRTLLRGNL